MRSNDYYDEEDIGPRRVSSMSREGPQEDLSLDPAPREAPVKKYPLCIILFLFLVVVTFVIVVVVATISTNHNSYNSAGIPTGAPATTIPSDEDLVIATTPNGTLGAIWKRGVLRCAVRYEVGRSQWNETRQQYDGFSVDLVRNGVAFFVLFALDISSGMLWIRVIRCSQLDRCVYCFRSSAKVPCHIGRYLWFGAS